MNHDFLEQLAQFDVPEPPVEFDRQLHGRMNQWLLVQQVIDLALRGVPWAILHFARALVGLGAFSITGRFPEERAQEPRDSV